MPLILSLLCLLQIFPCLFSVALEPSVPHLQDKLDNASVLFVDCRGLLSAAGPVVFGFASRTGAHRGRIRLRPEVLPCTQTRRMVATFPNPFPRAWALVTTGNYILVLVQIASTFILAYTRSHNTGKSLPRIMSSGKLSTPATFRRYSCSCTATSTSALGYLFTSPWTLYCSYASIITLRDIA